MMKRYLYIGMLMLLLAACSENVSMPTDCQEEKLPILIESTYPVKSALTRASIDNGFVADDAVGIFVVDYNSDGSPGTLALKGNRGNNVKFIFDGSAWTANYQMYWADSKTPADFYGYYPFDEMMQSTSDYSFSIRHRQDGDASTTGAADYMASDLLRAKAEKVTPTAETVHLQYKHLMAGITVSLEMGEGFEAGEWAALDKTVLIENTILNGSVDFSSGQVTVAEDGQTASIIPLLYNNTWRAVVFPQSVAAGKSLASVTVGGQVYKLVKNAAITYQSGKMHQMTITVNKRTDTGQFEFNLTADDIVAWVDDPQLHDGLTYAYTTVTVEEAGKLKEAIDAQFDDYSDVVSLKITGPLNSEDLTFIHDNLWHLKNVNLAKVTLVDGKLYGFADHSVLQHLVFPEKSMKRIGYAAFCRTSLSGPIVIPEGVEVIQQSAYEATKVFGTVTLPSTLKVMENFTGHTGRRLTGDLLLPEGIEEAQALEGNFTGTVYFPSSLKRIWGDWGYSNSSGTLVIPRCMTKVEGFGGSGCTQVEFHDGVTEIGGAAFRGSNLMGELVLPANLTRLGCYAFTETRITNIVFPDALRIMDSFEQGGPFAECTYLTGTLRLPKNVSRISAGSFRGCKAITGLVIPEGVAVIDKYAFKDCYSLNSIVCENPEPPTIYNNSFEGVPKDNFTVEVPKGSVEKYREAPGWKEFKRISEYSNFVCRPMMANALNNAHTEQLILNADGEWQVDRCPDWVTLSKTSGVGKTELMLTFKKMAHGNGHRSDSIIFKMPSENYRTFCVVSQYDYEQEEDTYITLQKASKGNRGGIDIVFIGDGYDGEDIANGNYLSLVKQQTEHFFDLEPYKSHRDYFNVYVTFPLSQEKGVNTMNTYVNNHFGTLYGYIGEGSNNQLLTEADEVRDYAVAHTPITQDNLGRSLIILVPNSDAYSGVTYYEWYGSPISICPASNRPYPQDARGVIQHEAGGHGFGRLGDEEIIYNAWAPGSLKAEIENKHRDGWYANLSSSSGLHSVPWADLVFDTRYSDYVDVFEGGFGYMRGIFRPEQNSCMNYGIPYYNAPSRLSIMRRIFDYAGVHFDMDYFYAHDSKAWGSSAATRTASGKAFCSSSYAGSNQHCMPSFIDARKMGNKVRLIIKNNKERKIK